MYIGTLIKAPSELAHMGVDYSRWLGSSKLKSVQASIARDVSDLPDTLPAQLWAVFIAPDGKSIHVFVERGTDGSDYSVVLVATAVSRLVREDDLVVRLEATV
jgi:hypothetical protein